MVGTSAREISPTEPGALVTVVIATRDRRAELVRTLTELRRGYPDVAVIVVDNASSDGTAAVLRSEWPAVTVISLARNAGAAARNVGVRRARTPYVAFSDDDSWWEPGSLERAAALLRRHPRLALVAARTLVGAGRRPDPINRRMLHGPLPRRAGPGPPVLGFLACSAVVRRRAFLDVGGFSELLFFVGEEKLLAQDLAAGGWELRYVDSIVARHHPSPARAPSQWRRALERRNTVLIAWLRRPVSTALRESATLVTAAMRDTTARRALASLVPRLPSALRERRRLPRPVEADVRLVEGA